MRRIALSTAACSVAIVAGCSTVATRPPAAGPSSGAFGYTAGMATQDFGPTPSAVMPALMEALADLKIRPVRQVREPKGYVIEGTTADDRRALVTLRPYARVTRLTARVGWFGDEPLSRALMDRVGVRLGSLPPAAIPSEAPSSPGLNPYFSRSAISDADMLREQADARYRDTTVP